MPRKAKISRDAVLAVALRLADDEGLPSLSMRKIGEALGVEAMSLYNHVPNKAAVLDGVHEAVLAEMSPVAETGDWKVDGRNLALAFWEALTRHPNVLVLFATRPAITLGSLDYLERGLRILAPAFPDMADRIYAFQTMVTFVVGHAMASAADPELGIDYGQLSTTQFPILASCGSALGGLSTRAEFKFGLEAILNGLAARAYGQPRKK